MLGDTSAVTNLAVKDVEAARKFYEGTLGLTPCEAEGEELVAYKSGSSTIYVYRSDYAGTNEATALTWPVGQSLEAEVQRLKDKGVAFEHYEMPGMTRQGDIYGDGEFKIAWFKDPDGNILAISS